MIFLEEEEKYLVTFMPTGRMVKVGPQVNLLEAARLADIPIIADCGGAGVCGKCRVKVMEGKVRGRDTNNLSLNDGQKDYVYSCNAFPVSDVVLDIPPQSLAMGVHFSVSDNTAISLENTPYAREPLVEKYLLEMTPPKESDGISDLDRLYHALGRATGIPSFTISHKALSALPGVLRKSGWRVTAALDRSCTPPGVLSVEEGDTRKDNYGIVIDIGTTTLEAVIMDIPTGQARYFTSHLNPQAKYGTDIMARLNFASRENGLLVLNDIIMDKINEILMEMAMESGVSKDSVYSLVISGNTVMIHLLLGLDTEGILRHPQIPVALDFPTFRARDLNLYTNPDAPVYITPGVGTYVGGDLISSLIYTGMPDEDFILVDIGTNGEVAMVSDGAVICAATSAGPAFEGGGVKWGMRATMGAINRVFFSRTHKDLAIATIGDSPPVGICGTGLIDVMATLLKTGFIDKKGRFRSRRNTSRIRSVNGVEEFVLAFSQKEEDVISITEQDIDYLLKSKGSLYTGFTFLLEKLEKTEKDVDRFFIAGALGGLLNVENGITIGLFPDLDRDKFHFLGNGSLHGGRILLLSQEAREKARAMAHSAAYFELSQEAGYMNSFTSSLFLPHTDQERFPTVMEQIRSSVVSG
jgi:uncharacterized 2Fe-2S/4Fe-4S cluster protein (DUF4445 family)